MVKILNIANNCQQEDLSERFKAQISPTLVSYNITNDTFMNLTCELKQNPEFLIQNIPGSHKYFHHNHTDHMDSALIARNLLKNERIRNENSWSDELYFVTAPLIVNRLKYMAVIKLFNLQQDPSISIFHTPNNYKLYKWTYLKDIIQRLRDRVMKLDKWFYNRVTGWLETKNVTFASHYGNVYFITRSQRPINKSTKVFTFDGIFDYIESQESVIDKIYAVDTFEAILKDSKFSSQKGKF